MAFGIAGAAAGANDALQEMLVRAFAQKQAEAQLALQQAAGQRADDALGLQRQEFGATQEARKVQQDRQAQADREAENARGVRRMIGDYLQQRGGKPLDAGGRQTVQGMAVSEGIDLPKELAAEDPATEDARKLRLFQQQQAIEHQNRLGEIGASGAQARQTAKESAAMLKVTSDKANQDASTAKSRAEVRDLAQSLLDDPELEGITGMIQGRRDTFLTPGAVDAYRRFVQLQNKLSVEARSKMKGQGQISDFEGKLLAGSTSALDRAAGSAKAKQHLKEIVDAMQGDAPNTTLKVDQTTTPDVVQWGRDAQGRPVRLK